MKSEPFSGFDNNYRALVEPSGKIWHWQVEERSLGNWREIWTEVRSGYERKQEKAERKAKKYLARYRQRDADAARAYSVELDEEAS